jgi:glycine dehydrogenase
MLGIRQEIEEIASGMFDAQQNVLHNAPHTLNVITSDTWELPYSRSKAAWPAPDLREGRKFWPAVGRLDGAYGDRNLVCACPPPEAYA